MTDVSVPKTFEVRMKERIKDSIGDLISDEDLSKIVEAGVKDAFFAPRKRTDGYRTVEDQPLIHNILAECLSKAVNEHVKNWVANHPEEIATIVKKYVDDGIASAVIGSINSMFTNVMFNFQQNMELRIRDAVNNRS